MTKRIKKMNGIDLIKFLDENLGKDLSFSVSNMVSFSGLLVKDKSSSLLEYGANYFINGINLKIFNSYMYLVEIENYLYKSITINKLN